MPSNSRGLDASLEGSTHSVQLSLRQTVGNFFDSCPPTRQLCLGLRLPFRQATTALGLGGYGGKQLVNFGIVQPHERSRQVLRQQVSGLGSFLLVRRKCCLPNNQRIGRPCWRRSRKQVWCLICRPADGHAPTMPPVPCHGNRLGRRGSPSQANPCPPSWWRPSVARRTVAVGSNAGPHARRPNSTMAPTGRTKPSTAATISSVPSSE